MKIMDVVVWQSALGSLAVAPYADTAVADLEPGPRAGELLAPRGVP
jgi:hypothetical protein